MEKSTERICFIFNPGAGNKRSARCLDWLREQALIYWSEVDFKVTKTGQDLATFAREAAGRYDKVIACGGDGTFSQVVNGMAGSSTPVGLIPIGSGNDFAKAMNLPADIEKCLQIIRHGKIKAVDLIRINGDADIWCGNTLGSGLDGWANYYKNDFPYARGTLVYLLGVLKAIFKFKGARVELEIDGQALSSDLYMVTFCNGQVEGGNFKVAPHADFSDGWLDLLVIDRIPVIRLLWYLPQFLFGARASMKGVRFYKCKSVKLSSDKPLAVHCDGEHLGTDIARLSAEVRQGVLNVIVP